MTDNTESSAATDAFRREYGRVAAALIGQFGDVDLVEDAIASARTRAVDTWPDTPPDNPVEWIVAAAHEFASSQLVSEHRPSVTAATMPSAVDERAGLVFVCCHPALPNAARVALTLRLFGGMPTEEIAAAFGVPESTMSERLSRAKERLRDHHLPYQEPSPSEAASRHACVLAVIHLIFDAGHLAAADPDGDRPDLAREAIGLGRQLVDVFPEEPEVRGLLALMLFTDSRRDARVGADGALIPIGRQDRDRWHPTEVEEARFVLRQAGRAQAPGHYQLLALIQDLHHQASTTQDTDWRAILALYDHLMLVAPSDSIALNRAVAVAEVEGPARALAEVEQLGLDSHVFHAMRADLLTRAGRHDEAERAWTAAAARAHRHAEHEELRAHLER